MNSVPFLVTVVFTVVGLGYHSSFLETCLMPTVVQGCAAIRETEVNK